MSKPIPLSKAGYREKVFAKARLCLLHRFDQKLWESTLAECLYYPDRDTIQGIGGVNLEGSQSLSILKRFGMDDNDCK